MRKSPIDKSSAPNGKKWNTCAASLNLPLNVQVGVCCINRNIAPRGHGGRVGYIGTSNSAVGIRCCERHGKSIDVEGLGITWWMEQVYG